MQAYRLLSGRPCVQIAPGAPANLKPARFRVLVQEMRARFALPGQTYPTFSDKTLALFSHLCYNVFRRQKSKTGTGCSNTPPPGKEPKLPYQRPYGHILQLNYTTCKTTLATGGSSCIASVGVDIFHLRFLFSLALSLRWGRVLFCGPAKSVQKS